MAAIRSFIKYWVLSAFAVYGWLRLRLSTKPTLIILTYHRVLPESSDERELEQAGMIISPGNLERHIKLVRSMGAVPVHLDEWLRKKEAGEGLPALSVAFTFDDGWRDNYLHGYPVLRKENVPATIFLVTGMIDTNNTFWPEQVIELLRNPEMNLNDPALEWLKPHLGTFVDTPPPLSLMEADEVISRLKSLDDKTIIQHLKKSLSSLKVPSKRAGQTPAILKNDELREMSANNLIKYGAHTRNHFRLNRLSNTQALEEQITGCLSDLQQMMVPNVPIFCYPNGDITDRGEEFVANHYQAACTTKSGWNRTSRSPFDLHRFNLHDGNSSTRRALLATLGRHLT